jgi:hypothetical protein
MATEQFLAVIQARAEGRFIVQAEGLENDELLALAPEALIDRQVIRLRRNGNEHAGWRTILIASLDNEQELTVASRWAADARDRLLEPETADLYMILSVSGLSDNEGASIEANEQFCRKFVTRSEETIEKLLDRTFLGSAITRSEGAALIDPFVSALLQTSEHHEWLDVNQREHWHKTLLSGKTGSDLFESILVEVPTGGDTL